MMSADYAVADAGTDDELGQLWHVWGVCGYSHTATTGELLDQQADGMEIAYRRGGAEWTAGRRTDQ